MENLNPESKKRPVRSRTKKKHEKVDDSSTMRYEELSKELKKMREEKSRLEDELRGELERISKEKSRLEENNRRLESELKALEKEIKREDETTHEIESKIEGVEKRVEGIHIPKEFIELKNEVQNIKEYFELVQKAIAELADWKTEISEKVHALEQETIDKAHVHDMKVKMEEMGRHISKKAEIDRIQKIEKGIKDIFEDIDELSEEMGYGESLNVAKIPPQVLEGAYQTILDDVVKELKKSFGPHETERVILSVTEELRQRTSGSELFRVRGPAIELEDVVMSIEKGLISNKQIQMTYEELLKKLAEHVPYYKPKNLRAMLRVKSLEFAVDRLRVLIAEHEYVKKELRRLLNEHDHSAAKEKSINNKGNDIPDVSLEETTGGEGSA